MTSLDLIKAYHLLSTSSVRLLLLSDPLQIRDSPILFVIFRFKNSWTINV
jgi:hypothetical protein